MEKGTVGVDTLVKILIGVVVFVFLVAIFLNFFSKAEASSEESFCAFTVRLNSKLHAGPLAFPIACEQQKLINIKDGMPLEKVDDTIADAMAKCWWMFGEGKLGELSDGYTFLTKYFTDPIFPCYVIHIHDADPSSGNLGGIGKDNSGKDLEDVDIYDFREFLNKPYDGNSYWNYIQNVPGTRSICYDKTAVFEKKGNKILFKEGEVYYILFRDDNDPPYENNDQILISTKSTFTGGISGKPCLDL